MKDFLTALFIILEKIATKEVFDTIVDKIIDVVEDWAIGDPTTEDDDKKTVLLLCAKLRTFMNVPDNDNATK